MQTDLDTVSAFLDRAGWGTARRSFLSGDASHRSYERLRFADRSAVLMIAPPEAGERIQPFVTVARFLLDHRLSAPVVIAEDIENGFLLLEDLGDDLFARLLEKTPDREALVYEAAVDLLLDLQEVPAPGFAQPYSANELVERSKLAWTWYADALPPTEFRGALLTQLGEVDGLCSVLTLRDYHAENLIWLPDRNGTESVGLLDFQDAQLGHPAYDLASLLEDARRDVTDGLRQHLIKRYLDGSGRDPAAFLSAYTLLAMQRNLRIIGTFARLAIRDGKPRYIDLIPRVWGHLVSDMDAPEMRGLRSMVLGSLPAPDDETLLLLRSRCKPTP